MFRTLSPPGMSKTLKILLASNVAIFLADTLTQGGIFTTLFCLHTPSVLSDFQVWRLGTYMFIHSINSVWHILINMLILWMFGISVVAVMGEKKFLSLYLSAGFFAGICSLVFDLITGNQNPYVGASGAIFAICVAFARYFPTREILLFFLFPVQAKWAVLIFIGIDLLLITSNDGVAHIAHLGGAVYALLYFRYEDALLQYLDKWKRRKELSMKKQAGKASSQAKRAMKDIDSILAKISREGIDSLTKEEKEALDQASETKRRQKEKIIRMEDFRRPKQ
jgi:membrane associated rhomboid family serine protease